jgi:glutamyl-tRNA synthetase
MHLGNVYSALLSWLSARSQGGQWLLRIEDIDPQRSRQSWADMLMTDLEWLGLTWDGTPVYQSRRSDIYEQYYSELQRQGLTYPCYCTRADIMATQAPHESDGRVVYAGTCRPKAAPNVLASSAGQKASLPPTAAATRLIVPDRDITFTDGHYGPQTVNLASHVGDFIIRRKDGAWAYQLAVVIDDALMGVNEVVRGRDLLLSSPQQIYVAGLLQLPSPRFVHLPLLCNEAGQRLSKRDRSLDMEQLRQRFTPDQIIGLLAHVSGLLPQPEPVSPTTLLPFFDWDKVPRQDIIINTTD